MFDHTLCTRDVVWRPVGGRHSNTNRHHLRHHGDVITTDDAGGNYMLIGQTHFHPSELRFHEFALADRRRIAFRRGDVLGLQFVRYNPLTWSSVPCARPAQRYLVHRPVTTRPLRFGMSLRFDVETGPDYHECRQYSFTAVLEERRGAKSVEDWQCPSTSRPRYLTSLQTDHVVTSEKRRSSSSISSVTRGQPGGESGQPAAEHRVAAATDAVAADRGSTDPLTARPYVVGTLICVVMMLIVVAAASYATAARS